MRSPQCNSERAALTKTPSDALRVNVGFLLKENVGFSREWHLDEKQLIIADDLELETLQGKVRMMRTSQGVYVEGELHTTHAGACVRCLRDLPILLSSNMAELYSAPPGSESEFAISEGGILNLAPLMRELVLLEEPIRPVCDLDCKGLCPDCGQNLNQSDCQCQRDMNEPRWSTIGALLEKPWRMEKGH